MKKNQKILSVIVATCFVMVMSMIANTLGAATAYYGPLGAYSVFIKNDYTMMDSTVEGRIAVGNKMSIGGTDATLVPGFDASTVIGYFLESTEYPSLVVKNTIELLDPVSVTNGFVTGGEINDETLLDFKDASFSYTQDESSNLEEGFTHFTETADDLVTELMNREADTTDSNDFQTPQTYYDKVDKSLLLMDLPGKEVEVDEALTSEASAETTKMQVDIDKINIDTLQSHEKLIIRSNADYINFNDVKITYEGSEIQIDLLDNLDENVESLANNIVWVFPNATEIKIDNSDVIGSILAPKATVTQTGGTLAGQLYADNFVQSEDAYIVNRVSFINEYDFDRDITSSTITIEFLDQYDVEIQADKVLTREVGTTLKLKVPGIDGYALNEVSTDTYDMLVNGFTVPETNEVITLHYDQLYSSTLTVSHVLQDGTNIVDPIVTHPDIGSSYSTEPLTDDAYTLIETPTNANGVMTKKVDVTYVYAPVGDARTITIRHVDETGSDLIAGSEVASAVGSAYDVTDYIIKNNVYQYQGLYTGSAPISGTTNSNITVIFQYKAVTTCAQFGTSTSGENADKAFDISGKSQATNNEVQYNEIQDTALVKGQATTNTSSGYNFGNEYSTESNNSVFMDYRYSFNGNKNYDNFIPVRQEGKFEPINIVVTQSGNGYDIRSRTSAAGLTTYTSGGINYQKKIASQGYKSLLIRFEPCQAVISFNDGSTTSNGTQIMTYKYTDFAFLGESVAGFTFDWDIATKKLTVNVIFEKDGKLMYSGNTFVINLSSYSFLPQDYAIAYTDTSATTTKLYKPYTSTDRYMYEVIGLQSPYVDTTTTKFNASQAVSKNMLYGVYTLNGKVSNYSQLTSSSAIKEATLPYNPNSYSTMITGSNTFPNKASAVYGYVAGGSYTPVTGFTLSAESEVVYGKNKHPKYSMSVTASDAAIIEGRYTSLEQVPNLDLVTEVYKNGETTTTGDAVDNVNYLVLDESAVNFNKQGTYSAIGYAQTRDVATGELINAYVKINVTVTGAVLDYGDAPSTYGEAGAKVGNSKYRYNIGINRNGNRATHADAEAAPLYSSDARGDDMSGMTDETGWFNMDTDGIGELNIEMEKMRISFPYTATGNAAVAFWIDYNQNGKFEDFEGSIENVTASNYDEYGIVNFDIDLSPSFSTLEAGDSTYARVRILSSKQNLSVADAATTYDKYYGETEDFVVKLYGKKNEYQICTQILANTPIVTVKNVSTVKNAGPNNDESGIKYVFDIGDANPNSNSSNSFYPDVQVTVTSKQGIVSNTKAGEPAYFRVEQDTSPYERPANTIHIQSRNKAGEPINLPFTFSFWDLDDFTGSSVIESVSLGKDSVYMEGLAAADIKRTKDSVGVVEDFGTYLKLFTTRQVESEPEAMFIMQGTSLAKSDIEIVEEARLLEIGIGLDLGQMDKVIDECVEPYEPKAQIEILGEFYDDEVSVYNSYPFAYQSTNIPFPYFPNLNSITQNLYIPEGVQFVDGNTDVTVYRRDLLGSRRESDWEVVDESLYTQTLDLENNISSVTFDDPIGNKTYGYEYRMEYNFEISEDMKTGQRVVFKSDFEYNKGKTSENTEVYALNDVTAIVKEAFTADVNTVMADDLVHVETDSNAIYYTYEYLNCDTCTNVTEPTRLEGDIPIPIPDIEDMDFYSEAPFDMYEDIEFTLYDNEMKVFEFPVRRWYPTELALDLDNVTDIVSISEGLNPVAQTIQVRAAYKAYEGFDAPVTAKYSQETISVGHDTAANEIQNSVLELDDINATISTEPSDKVPASWGEGAGDFQIEIDDLAPVYDSNIVYITPEEKICTGEEEAGTECLPQGYHAINIEADALDDTLETAKVSKDGTDYKTILFKDSYKTLEDGSLQLTSTLDDRYVIEKFSGRIYNKDINKECKMESASSEDYTGLYCYGDVINNYQIATADSADIIAGFNDSADGDLIIADTINGMPLATDLEQGDAYDYLVYLKDFGKNKTSITISDKLEIKTTPLEYYGDEGTFYFKRTHPTEEEVKCIKEADCTEEYQTVTSGQVTSTFEIKNKIENDTSLLNSYKSLNEWLNEYIS